MIIQTSFRFFIYLFIIIIIYFFLLMYGRDSAVLVSDFRNGEFDGITRFEIL